MFTFDATDIQRLAVSAIGALVLSVTCIVGAVGPARAAETATDAIGTGSGIQHAAR